MCARAIQADINELRQSAGVITDAALSSAVARDSDPKDFVEEAQVAMCPPPPACPATSEGN